MAKRSNFTPLSTDLSAKAKASGEYRSCATTGNRQPATNSVKPGAALDFSWCLQFLEKRGKEFFGQKFIIHQQDHEIIYRLLVYFIGDKTETERLGLDMEKGILLTGPIGCGKTSLMNLMRFVPPPERNYMIKSCRDISFDFIRDGYDVIGRYSRMSFNNHTPKIYCFDDLGAEQTLKYFGNECNAMAEILLSRYDFYTSQRMISHVTTNLPQPNLKPSMAVACAAG